MKINMIINKYFLKITLLIALFFLLLEANCQDSQFSQFYNSPILLNPSLTGAINGKIRILTNYRNQWSSITKPYKTFAFTFDIGLMKKKGKRGFIGAGLSFLSDEAGSSQLGFNQVNLSLAYHTHISSYNNLSAGIVGGFSQRYINYSKLEWNSQYNGNNFDPNLPTYEIGYSENRSYPDFGAGLEWTYTKGEMYAIAKNQPCINVGFSVFHVNHPNISFHSSANDNLPIKFIFHGNTQICFNNKIYSFVPSILFVKQGTLKDIIVGGLARKKLNEESRYTGFNKGSAISLGCLYRIGDAVIPYWQLEFANYAIGLSYDINISGLTIASSGRGGFEISIRWLNPNPFTGKIMRVL